MLDALGLSSANLQINWKRIKNLIQIGSNDVPQEDIKIKLSQNMEEEQY